MGQIMNEKEQFQEEFMNGLKKEVDELEAQINTIVDSNTKKTKIKNIKLFARSLARNIPYILVFTFWTGMYTHFVGIPILPSLVKVPAYVQNVYDNHNHHDEIRNYTGFESDISKIELFSKWKKEDNYYVRTKKTYHLDESSIDKYLEYLEQNDFVSLEKLFDTTSDLSVEKTNRQIDENNNDNSIVATIYNRDNDDILIRMRTSSEHNQVTWIYIIALIFFEALTWVFCGFDNRKYKKSLEKIKEKYKIEDYSELEKTYILKRDNYNRLAGNSNGRK